MVFFLKSFYDECRSFLGDSAAPGNLPAQYQHSSPVPAHAGFSPSVLRIPLSLLTLLLSLSLSLLIKSLDPLHPTPLAHPHRPLTTLPTCHLGPLHTRAESHRDRDIVRAQKEVSKAVVPTHLQHHVVWSQALKSSVKPYVTGSSTKCYLSAYLFMQVFKHGNIE